MRKLLAVLAAGVLAGMAPDDEPINKTCPIKGTPAKPNLTATYMGKVIAFC